MILLSSSLFLFLLGRVYRYIAPNEINWFWGFRSKKAMKNQKNWDTAQQEFARQATKIFFNALRFSIIFLIADIFFLFPEKDTYLVTSLLLQSIVLIGLCIYVYFTVNRQLD